MSGFDLTGCSALVTGASAGIGREFARQLAGRARSIVLVARRIDRLEELRDELTKADPNLNVQTRAVDLSQPDEIENLCRWLSTEAIAIDFLVNNAGLGDRGTFATAEPDLVRQILAVNIVALTVLSRRLLPGMLAKKHGAILNVSSVAGFLPIRKFAVYAASKAYVTSFTDGVRAEVRKQGVTVSALCPGPVDTEFNSVATRGSRERHPPSPSFVHMPVADVVRAGLAGIERDRPVVIPGLAMKIAMLLVRLTPMPILRRL